MAAKKNVYRRILSAGALLLLLCAGIKSTAQTDYTIGTVSGNTFGGYPCPFQDLYEGSRQQFLYRATDLAAAGMTTAGNITAIKFNVLDVYTTGIIEDYTVKIKQVPLAALTLTGWEAGATTVYGPVNYQPTNGVNTLTFSTPYAWDGTSALLVEICNGGADWTDNVDVAYTTVPGVQVSRIYRADGLGSLCGYTGAAVGGQNATNRVTRPVATFTVIVPVPCSGAPTIGNATSSASTLTCSGTTQLNLASYPLNLTGITYKWQSSPAGLNTWGDISGNLTTPAFTTGTITDNTDFRAVATCGGSPTNSSTVTVNVTKISTTPATSTICDGNSQTLTAVSPLPTSPTLYSQNFNSGTGDLTFVNNTSGGLDANAAWTIQADGYTDQNGYEFHSPTNTSFIISNSDLAGNGASVHTEMITPDINTSGYATLSLTFAHHKANFLGAVSSAKVEVSTNGGGSWSAIPGGTFSGGSNIGASDAFAPVNLNLDAYINSNIRLRWVYDDVNWNFFYAVDDILLSGTSLPPSTYTWSSSSPGAGLPGVLNTTAIAVTPTNGTGSYTYTVASNNCGSATATVNVVPAPTATIVSAGDVCDGEAATINFTGNPGDVITFNTTESVTLNGAGQATYTTPVLTAGSYTYTINTIANTTCTVSSTLSATQVVNPAANGQLFSNTPTVCKDQSASIAFSSTATDYPITVQYSDGTSGYTYTANTGTEYIPVPSNVPGAYTYTITNITNQYGCDGTPGIGSGSVTVSDRPTATFSSSAAGVCAGSSATVTLTFTGTGPFVYGYTDGTTPVNGVEPTNSLTFNVTPTTDVTYSTNTLLDQTGCAVTPADIASTVTVQVYDTSKITVDPLSVSACTQNSATITMTATGDVLSYAWYEDGILLVAGPNYTINNNTLTINDVTGLGGNQYHVVVSGACGVDKTSNSVTLTEDFNNSWSGTVSTDWSDGMNWSCGNVPIITTNVIIPTSAPFMPLVDITSAICNNFTMNGTGATLGFENTGNILTVHGNVTVNTGGEFDGTDGTVVFAGNNQTVTGSTIYEDLEVTGGGTKTLNGEATVMGELMLTNGLVAIGNNDLTISDMSLQTTGSATSYIVTDGTGEVVGQNMGADSTVFHVGLPVSYNPVGIKNTGDADTFMVRVMEHVYVDGDGTNPEEMMSPEVDRTWMISEQTPGGSFASVTPQWNAAEEINGFDPLHVYVSHYTGGTWTAEYDSSFYAGPRLGTDPYTIVEDSFTSFSPFAVGSHGQFPLSIRMATISATNVGTRNKVEWKSATEATGDVYEVESSVDAKSFKKIATVAANGKPSSYLQWDENPAQGVNYYRVKLIDAAGKFSYSKVVTATVNGVNNFTIEAYPNPVRSTVSVKVNGVVTGKGNVVVTDVTGKVVTTSAVVENNGAELNVSHLANGMYLLNYTDDVRNESIKINKQ